MKDKKRSGISIKDWFTILSRNFFTYKNFRAIIIIFVTGFFYRYLIQYFFDVNVFKEPLNNISLTFYAIMAFFSWLLRQNINIFDFPVNNWSLMWDFIFKTILGERYKILKDFFAIIKDLYNNFLFIDKNTMKGDISKSISIKSKGQNPYLSIMDGSKNTTTTDLSTPTSKEGDWSNLYPTLRPSLPDNRNIVTALATLREFDFKYNNTNKADYDFSETSKQEVNTCFSTMTRYEYTGDWSSLSIFEQIKRIMDPNRYRRNNNVFEGPCSESTVCYPRQIQDKRFHLAQYYNNMYHSEDLPLYMINMPSFWNKGQVDPVLMDIVPANNMPIFRQILYVVVDNKLEQYNPRDLMHTNTHIFIKNTDGTCYNTWILVPHVLEAEATKDAWQSIVEGSRGYSESEKGDNSSQKSSSSDVVMSNSSDIREKAEKSKKRSLDSDINMSTRDTWEKAKNSNKKSLDWVSKGESSNAQPDLKFVNYTGSTTGKPSLRLINPQTGLGWDEIPGSFNTQANRTATSSSNPETVTKVLTSSNKRKK